MRAHRLLPIVTAWCVLLAFCGSASAQPSGGNFVLPVGGVAGGGGSSAGGNYAATGYVPLAGVGRTTGGLFVVHGGLVAAANSGVSAVYVGNAIDTVPVADRRLSVVVAGGGASGTIYYRAGGATTYSSAAMTASGLDTLFFNLPAARLGVRGLEYYFEVTQGAASGTAGSAGNPYIFVTNMTNAQSQRPTPLPDARYSIVSVPIDVTPPTNTAAVFSDDLGSADPKQWRLFSFDASGDSVVEYPAAADVVARRAYWLAARGARRYGAAGTSRSPNRIGPGSASYFEVALDSGWNLLANPLPFAVDWVDVVLEYNATFIGGHPDSLIRDSAYTWTGSAYQTVQTINAWAGAFLEVAKPSVKVLFRYQEAGAVPVRHDPAPAVHASSSHWTLKLRVDQDGFADDGNFIGVRPDAKDGPDRYDFPKPPAAPEGVQLAFRLPDDSHHRGHRTDYRPPFKEGASWDLEISPGLNRRLMVTGLEQLPPHLEAVLILGEGQQYLLDADKRIDLPDDACLARIVIGTAAYAAAEAELPRSFELHANFPNPFNPSTNIRFSLPTSSDVRLSIYNVLGQRVRLLTDAHYEAGVHDLAWDGRDEQSRPAGSGVYFCRLESGSITLSRKMLLLK